MHRLSRLLQLCIFALNVGVATAQTPDEIWAAFQAQLANRSMPLPPTSWMNPWIYFLMAPDGEVREGARQEILELSKTGVPYLSTLVKDERLLNYLSDAMFDPGQRLRVADFFDLASRITGLEDALQRILLQINLAPALSFESDGHFEPSNFDHWLGEDLARAGVIAQTILLPAKLNTLVLHPSYPSLRQAYIQRLVNDRLEPFPEIWIRLLWTFYRARHYSPTGSAPSELGSELIWRGWEDEKGHSNGERELSHLLADYLDQVLDRYYREIKPPNDARALRMNVYRLLGAYPELWWLGGVRAYSITIQQNYEVDVRSRGDRMIDFERGMLHPGYETLGADVVGRFRLARPPLTVLNRLRVIRDLAAEACRYLMGA